MNNRLLIPLLAVGLLATACAGGAPSTATPAAVATASPATATATPATATATAATATATPATATAAPATAAAGTPVAGGETVQLATTDLGEIVVDSAGMTLYGFTPDEATGEPTCYDQCTAAWPPLNVDGAFTVGEGLDMADFSTATRTDGGTQLKLGTYPLYYFANDEAPGDTNGQGLNEVWFVIGADGELIRD
jgi:predicted lipoprotein with Yx(FWY)xxD motif